MPHKIQITVRRWLGWKTRFRRELPSSWAEILPGDRLPLLRILVAHPGSLGRLKVIRKMLELKTWVWRALSEDDLAALLDHTEWMTLRVHPEPTLPWFEYKGETYYAPSGHGLNLVALEYPIADEAFGKFVNKADRTALALLVATLYRPANPDADAVVRRGDIRVPLLSRWEAEERAKHFLELPEAVNIPALLYFAGLKEYVHKAYGKALFEEPEEDEHGNEIPPSNPNNLGWWSVYFTLATDGPFGRNVEEVYQTSFHDVCLYLVDRRRQEERRMMQDRLRADDFGIQAY